MDKLNFYLTTNYSESNGIIKHFYCLFDEVHYNWYFSLDENELANFINFKELFLKYSSNYEYNY